MLKFEDERYFRCRANVRSLRRMVLRLTKQLSCASSVLKPTVSKLPLTSFARSSGKSSTTNDAVLSAAAVTAASATSSATAATSFTGAVSPPPSATAMSIIMSDESNDSEAASISADEISAVFFAGDASTADKKAGRRVTDTDSGVDGVSDETTTTTAMTATNPFDRPLTDYIHVTKLWLMQLCEQMLRLGYSLSYMRNMLSLIRHDAGKSFPLTPREMKSFHRSIVSSKRKYYGDRHKQTDEVYSMCDKAYELMRVYCSHYLRAVHEQGVGVDVVGDSVVHASRYYVKKIIFCYLYLMMFYTGKRMSDLCILRVTDLENLLANEDIAVRIPKTERIGRISLSKIENVESFVRFVQTFIEITRSSENLRDIIPFDQFKVRRQLNRTFKLTYESVMKQKKPNGLSFHSLRRRKAAKFYKSGEDLETIRECLDHATTKMTNVYINKFLLSTDNRVVRV